MTEHDTTDDGLTFGEVSCTLNESQQKQRADWVRENVLSYFRDLDEREDGVKLTFDATEESLLALAELIHKESGCCSQNTFDLEVAPPYEEFTVTVTGPDGTKQLMKRGFIDEFDIITSSS